MILVKLILVFWCLLNVTGKFAIGLQENESVSVIIRGAGANRIGQLYSLAVELASSVANSNPKCSICGCLPVFITFSYPEQVWQPAFICPTTRSE